MYAVVLNLLVCLYCFGKKLYVEEPLNMLSIYSALHIQIAYFCCSRIESMLFLLFAFFSLNSWKVMWQKKQIFVFFINCL